VTNHLLINLLCGEALQFKEAKVVSVSGDMDPSRYLNPADNNETFNNKINEQSELPFSLPMNLI
jgi:hypothetical protein